MLRNPARLIMWFAVSMLMVSTNRAAGLDELARLEQEANEAAAHLDSICRDAWCHDNLRPTILRASAPLGTPWNSPEVPGIHLSPGSPDHRRVVGEMMYWYWLCFFRKQRLEEFKKQGVPLGGQGLLEKSIAASEALAEDMQHTQAEPDHAKASYGRAYTRAGLYINLRPRCRTPGFEAATILNPFLPVPKLRLSETSPDYKETVKALSYWEPNIEDAAARLQDLFDDRQAAAAAVVAFKDKPFDEKLLAADHRLDRRSEIFQKLKRVAGQWRKN